MKKEEILEKIMIVERDDSDPNYVVMDYVLSHEALAEVLEDIYKLLGQGYPR